MSAARQTLIGFALVSCLLLLPRACPADAVQWLGRALVVEDLAPATDEGPAGARILWGGREICRREGFALGSMSPVDLTRDGKAELLLPWYGGGTARSLILEVYAGKADDAVLLARLGEDGAFLRGRWTVKGSFLLVEHQLHAYQGQAGGIRRTLHFRWRRGKFVRGATDYGVAETPSDRLNLAWALHEDGRSVEARAQLKIVLADGSLDPWLRADAGEMLSRILRATGAETEAVTQARDTIALAPDGAAARRAADRLLREKLSRLGTPRASSGGSE